MDNTSKTKKEIHEAWHADPKNWRLGIFYYNKDDKRILPPKRFPILGWTVNFANPYSWVLVFGLITGVILILKLLPR